MQQPSRPPFQEIILLIYRHGGGRAGHIHALDVGPAVRHLPRGAVVQQGAVLLEQQRQHRPQLRQGGQIF